jgi:hypothetical protein
MESNPVILNAPLQRDRGGYAVGSDRYTTYVGGNWTWYLAILGHGSVLSTVLVS